MEDKVATSAHSRKEILVRLKRIEGQVRGLQRLVEEESSCSEILTQVTAVRGAISQVGVLVLETHVRECLLAAMNEGPEAVEKTVDDLVTLLSRMFK